MQQRRSSLRGLGGEEKAGVWRRGKRRCWAPQPGGSLGRVATSQPVATDTRRSRPGPVGRPGSARVVLCHKSVTAGQRHTPIGALTGRFGDPEGSDYLINLMTLNIGM